MKEVILKDLNQTREWAGQFAKTLHAPQTIALNGNLGMGKSEIARAIIKTLRGAETIVPSPTFTIVQNYDGISHFDLYRITDESELTEIGLMHAIENDITLIEWPQIAEKYLPKDTINIFIEEFEQGRKLIIK
ncbi:MAG TPA: tRNA (adenosine(37)-N6)-threonylcarbamoyltransferase complex ATPase subunit type 1 TsaE [Alphaproteobacteria bacterium]|nr:tRNA (adenosine(37)-N6)-threonylcarbamoyltransferase complex ATPase subunit type 1 TsaE [Alphaproteobacteria bacterium]